jgi:hypothetical protein
MPVNCGHAFILSEGVLYCCGLNEAGQLGVGDTNQRPKFTLVPTPIKFSVISAGYLNHTVAVQADNGSLWSWGDNSKGAYSFF